MNKRLQVLTGFIEFFISSFAVFVVEIVVVATGDSLPTRALSVVYSLGLLQLAIFPMVINRPPVGDDAEAHMEFAKGARYAAAATTVGSILQFFIVSAISSQNSVASGLLYASLGSMWLPYAWTAEAYGRLLVVGKPPKEFSSGNKKSSERVSRAFLALFLGGYRLLRQDWLVTVLLPILLLLHVAGWVVLSFAGGYPLTILGVGFFILALALPFLSFRSKTSKEDRDVILHLLAKALPSGAQE